MPYDSRVFRILIASPSDVEEERDIAVRVIQEWNDLYSYSRKVVLLPLRWETHTAPDFGTRPQEVINRAIVDNCDLLLGIFWTRIGTPTGEADSGTIEEIQRVASAGKPVMLYFSKAGIDPGGLDLAQVAKLKDFKENTYPNALTESYKSVINFRDKLSKQLEMKVRELQRDDESGQPPSLFLEFISPSTGDIVGSKEQRKLEIPKIGDLDAALSEIQSEKGRTKAKNAIEAAMHDAASGLIPLVIRNTSASGIRNLYVEITLTSTSDKVKIADSRDELDPFSLKAGGSLVKWLKASREKNTSTIDLHSMGHITKKDDTWIYSFEWGALQPQRTRLITPNIFIHATENTVVNVRARVYADSFAQPILLEAELTIDVVPQDVSIDELIPNLDKLKALAETPDKQGDD
ncbi:hypothetical protein ACFL6U_31775 [Planctomycetota bacterium]